jgi:hypothetical protein
MFAVAAAARAAVARSLEEALVGTFPGALRADGEGLARVLARTVAGSFPVSGASASFVYRYDPKTDLFRRAQVPLGPVFSERADTLGERRLSVAVNYLVADYDSINGRDLDALVSRDPAYPGDHIQVCAAVCEPVVGVAHVDLEAQIVALSVTYGLTPDLDLNLFIPLVRTFLRARTTFEGPDPRAPFMPGHFLFTFQDAATEVDEGVGDVLIRARHAIASNRIVDAAVGLTVSLPTGAQGSFHGTGDTQVGTGVYLSRTFRERLQPHLNLVFVLNADKLDRSQVRYSAGADVRVFNWLTLNNDFLGRSDVAQPDSIDRPVFLQIERADVLQFSTGLKVAPLERLVLFFNALLPVNRDSVRADLVVAAGVEAVF